MPCLLHIAMCSALCNESVLQYNPYKGNYEKIGESTEVALRVLAEKVYLYPLWPNCNVSKSADYFMRGPFLSLPILLPPFYSHCHAQMFKV